VLHVMTSLRELSVMKVARLSCSDDVSDITVRAE
jgi:hypothetical protein